MSGHGVTEGRNCGPGLRRLIHQIVVGGVGEECSVAMSLGVGAAVLLDRFAVRLGQFGIEGGDYDDGRRARRNIRRGRSSGKQTCEQPEDGQDSEARRRIALQQTAAVVVGRGACVGRVDVCRGALPGIRELLHGVRRDVGSIDHVISPFARMSHAH